MPIRIPDLLLIEVFCQRISEIDRRIADLLTLRDTLQRIRSDGAALPPDKQCDEQCVCYLASHEEKI